MKYLEEYRNPELVKNYTTKIQKLATKQWNIMEVCGGQTHSIVKFGLDTLVKNEVNLIHGPGCPVCVTPTLIIDTAIAIALLPNVIFCTFGDMMRVPGSQENLLIAKAKGAQVRMVYSPLDALDIARKNPQKKIVFFAIGFETTAPSNAMAVFQAAQENLNNFFVLVSHVLVPPALHILLGSSSCQIDALLAAGHVCTITGYNDYKDIAHKYKIPIVITGFEPVDILQGIYMCLLQLENNEAKVENAYTRFVVEEGNLHAQKMMQEIFVICDTEWRGIGLIPQSGLKLTSKYEKFNAQTHFNIYPTAKIDDNACISGLILQGIKKPNECPHFGKTCNPTQPLGATMVSSEGACAAYYQYQKWRNV